VNLDAVELGIVLIYYFTILVIKCPLPEASQSLHRSANNKIADEIAGRRRLLASGYQGKAIFL
jgi:hypothetical protein